MQTPEERQWLRIEELFGQASGLPRDERAQFVHAACAGDQSLIKEVQSLLSALEGGERVLEESPIAKALAHGVDQSPGLPPDARHTDVTFHDALPEDRLSGDSVSGDAGLPGRKAR